MGIGNVQKQVFFSEGKSVAIGQTYGFPGDDEGRRAVLEIADERFGVFCA